MILGKCLIPQPQFSYLQNSLLPRTVVMEITRDAPCLSRSQCPLRVEVITGQLDTGCSPSLRKSPWGYVFTLPFPHRVPPLVPTLWPHCPGGDIRLWSSWPDNGAECPRRLEVLGEREGGKSQAVLPQRPRGWAGDSGARPGL